MQISQRAVFVWGASLAGAILLAYSVSDVLSRPIPTEWIILLVLTAASGWATLRIPAYLKAADGDYMRLSGTSMATAVTSGVVALALEAHRATAEWNAPRPTPNAVKAALQYTALAVKTDIGIEDNPLRQGSGALNGKGAIELTRGMDTTKPEGSPWLNPAPAPWTVIAGVWLPWRQQIIWDTGVIWGSTVDINQKAWGAGVILGFRQY